MSMAANASLSSALRNKRHSALKTNTFYRRIIMNSCIKKAISLACATMLLAAALSGCGGTSSAAPASSAASASSESESLSCGTRINMSTASSGSLFYTGGIAVTQLWTEKLGAIASASSSSGSAENATLLISRSFPSPKKRSRRFPRPTLGSCPRRFLPAPTTAKPRSSRP